MYAFGYKVEDYKVQQQAHFFVLEGLDGSGKSTQCKMLSQALQQRGYTVVETREPTNGPWGQKIREMAQSGQRVAPELELEWFIQDRREHLEHIIWPALHRGDIVLQDRYFLSTMAYQGSRGLDPSAILREHLDFAPIPQRTFILDIPAQVGLDRVRSRQDIPDAFERLDALEKCAAVFNTIELPGVTHVDGALSAEELHTEILRYTLQDLM